MIKKFILISDESNTRLEILENIEIFQILPKINKKIPICLKLGKYSNNKIIHKMKEYNITNNNEIIPIIDSIIKTLSNDIYFDEIIIELNSKKNIECYDLPSYIHDYVDNKLISLYEKYLKLENTIIINLTNNIKLNEYIDLLNQYENDTIVIFSDDIENENEIILTKYKKWFQINNNNYKEYLNNLMDSKKININYILNNLYLDLDNYEDLLNANYDKFFNNIYISNNYRHHHFYKIIYPINLKGEYNEIKQNFYKYELHDNYKDYCDLIYKAIEIFDEVFDYYIKKIEPEILKYFVIMYYNSNEYSEEFENNKNYEFVLMIKGIRKMCISLVKTKLKQLNLI
jgi:hypothetical protein